MHISSKVRLKNGHICKHLTEIGGTQKKKNMNKWKTNLISLNCTDGLRKIVVHQYFLAAVGLWVCVWGGGGGVVYV